MKELSLLLAHTATWEGRKRRKTLYTPWKTGWDKTGMEENIR